MDRSEREMEQTSRSGLDHEGIGARLREESINQGYGGWEEWTSIKRYAKANANQWTRWTK